MIETTKISIFKGRKIRKTLFQNEWWFSVVDVVEALTDSSNPNDIQKDFDKWNEVKKKTDGQILPEEFFCYEREIWWGSIGRNIGVEANGKEDFFERPVLIIRVFNKEMIWVLPITSTIKESPFYYNFVFNNLKQSVMITQIRTISSKRLRRKVGTILDSDYKNIVDFLIKFVKNETPPKDGESRRPKPLMPNSVSSQNNMSSGGGDKESETLNKE